jgi:hypothetical protein
MAMSRNPLVERPRIAPTPNGQKKKRQERKNRADGELRHTQFDRDGTTSFGIRVAWQERDMTDTTRITDTTTVAFATAERIERKTDGVLEFMILSLVGSAVTLLLIAHDIPIALQLTVMQ